MRACENPIRKGYMLRTPSLPRRCGGKTAQIGAEQSLYPLSPQQNTAKKPLKLSGFGEQKENRRSQIGFVPSNLPSPNILRVFSAAPRQTADLDLCPHPARIPTGQLVFREASFSPVN
jgi:hypothetical protein